MRVVHVGVTGDQPGGMAQVVRQMMSWRAPGLVMASITTTRRKHDRLAPLLWALAVVRLCALRPARGQVVLAIHLSEKGSFLREGSLVVLAKFLGMPVVAHLHGADFDGFAKRRPGLVTAVLKRTAAIAVLTEGAMRTCYGLLGEDAPVVLVRNSVPVPEASSAKEDWFLFAGEVGHRKGSDVLVEAWKARRDHLPGWQLHVVGPQSDSFPVDLAAVVGLHHHGSLRNDDVKRLLDRSRIAVLPSRAEALPMFILEAMAAGNAVIATDVGQVRSVVSADVGRLVAAGDAADLGDAMMVLANSAHLDGMRGAARERIVANFSEADARRTFVYLWSGALRATA